MRDDAVILIAEDDTGHFALVKKNLWRSCVCNDILHFRDGQEILDFLFMRGDGPKMIPGTPYILLLDIRMPKVDGIEVKVKIGWYKERVVQSSFEYESIKEAVNKLNISYNDFIKKANIELFSLIEKL